MPAGVHMLRGNPSKKAFDDLTGDFSPPVEIPNCPPFLMAEAKKEWRRITPLLAGLGLIAKIDQASIAIYCAAYAWWQFHEQHLQADIQDAKEARAAWEAIPENAGKRWHGGDGFQLPTPNGSVTYNPHWVGKNKAMEQIDKFAANFGGAAAFRGRVTPSTNNPHQSHLPGFEPGAAGQSTVTSLLDFAKTKP